MRSDEVMIAKRGPPLCNVHNVAGEAATKAKRKHVLSQLMMLEVVEKNSAVVLATAA